MIATSNINLDYIYLVNRRDLRYILRTGVIPKNKTTNNGNDKIFLIKDEIPKVLILKNMESNKLSDSPQKVWDFIKKDMARISNTGYKLYKISIEKYLYKKSCAKHVTDIVRKSYERELNGIKRDKSVDTNVMIDSKDNNLDQIIERILSGISDNKNLIISEKNNKIYLPYTVNEIDDYMRYYPLSYLTSADVVRKEFTLELNSFTKHPYKSRFVEAYNLIRNRENRSIISSLNMAFWLSIKRELNPAIIAACRTIDELNKYLMCLKENELENFKTFNTIYEFSRV